LFSTITRWPSASPSLSATKRAGISVGPPAPKPNHQPDRPRGIWLLRARRAAGGEREQEQRAAELGHIRQRLNNFCGINGASRSALILRSARYRVHFRKREMRARVSKDGGGPMLRDAAP
jgi:hypothetical protein